MSKGWDKIIDKLQDFEMKKGLHSFINPYSMLLLEDKEKIADQIDYWYIDGISLVTKINKAFHTRYGRSSFDNTSLAPLVFKFVEDKKLKIAVVGTKPEYINQAVNTIETSFSIKVNYFRNGYFDSESEKYDCFDQIIRENIDVVVVGMGTPYQEQFLVDLKNKGWDGYGFSCGGYLHQIAKSKDYYPPFFDKYNLRWLYRMIDEPRLIKRYSVDYPLFFLKFRNWSRK